MKIYIFYGLLGLLFPNCVKQNVRSRQDREKFTIWHVFSWGGGCYCWCVALGRFAINVCVAVCVTVGTDEE